MYSPFAEDFQRHSHTVFAQFVANSPQDPRRTNFGRIARHRKEEGRWPWQRDHSGLAAGWAVPAAFMQFLVVNDAALGRVLEHAKEAIYAALKDSVQVVFQKGVSQ
jgi:hypothetical protein